MEKMNANIFAIYILFSAKTDPEAATEGSVPKNDDK